MVFAMKVQRHTARCILTIPRFAEPVQSPIDIELIAIHIVTILGIACEKSLAHGCHRVDVYSFFQIYEIFMKYAVVTYWGELSRTSVDCNRSTNELIFKPFFHFIVYLISFWILPSIMLYVFLQ